MNDTREIVLSRRVACLLRTAVEERHTSSRALAETLGVSPGTIDQYFKLAMRELGVHSRGEAIIRALELGLIPGHVVVHPEGVSAQPTPTTSDRET